LEELYFSHNEITELPQTLFLLSGLTVLTLSHNHLSILPDYFPSFKSLQVLSLSNNRFKKEDLEKKIFGQFVGSRKNQKKTNQSSANQQALPLLWVSVGQENRDPIPDSF